MEEIDGKRRKLPPSEAAKRVRAARELGGFRTQEKFKQALAGEKDFAPSRLKDIESLKGAELQGYEVEMFARFLGLPERWFTAPLEELFSDEAETPEPSLAARLASIDQQLEKLPERLVKAVDRLLQGPGQANPTSAEGSAPTRTDEGDPPDAQELP